MHRVDQRHPGRVRPFAKSAHLGLDEVEPAARRGVPGDIGLAATLERGLEDRELSAPARHHRHPSCVCPRPRQHGHLDLRAKVRPERVGEPVNAEAALADDRRAAGEALADREVLLERLEADALGAEARRRDLGVHVERRVRVVQADPALAHCLEGLAGEREEARLVGEVERVLGEDEGRGLEPLDDPVAREDAGHRPLDLLCALQHQPVPPALPARLHVLAPVRLGVGVCKRLRPVVAADVGDPEVGVELGDQSRQLHPTDSRAEPTDCRARGRGVSAASGSPPATFGTAGPARTG